MDWIEGIGFLGTGLVIVSTAMTTMIPLRIIGICASCALIIYGILIHSWPVIVTELFELPLNTYRLWQMFRLVRETKAAAEGDLSFRWLRPFGTERTFGAGETVFRAGDPAQEMYYVEDGVFRVPEMDLEVRAGGIVGELGLLSPGNARTASLVCVEPGKALCVTYADLKELYYQNPDFGFYFLKLTTERLFQSLPSTRKPVAAADAL
ncbi:cyclic nucleotide-binding domain-containing protein [Methylobacterium sp. J-030]|uniref:Crp/Fnr family transcriptional regulator n=1 Tax=Methylobacterium sp. J-030 TaxID=2836627 RepID=UPI001FB87E16|nr:cyclic nucleotide-binding domain-containing protein [Methylobacterium sp. J-030]MCJ2069071.1 cyclic nucleotide-binding domain-containing protein [Methylobacterium sp. J-030]